MRGALSIVHRPSSIVHRPLWLGVGVTLAAFILYLFTLAPSVMPGDYAEFQMSAAVLGVPHPTGYPLYIILGKLFTVLPFGDVAYRVNLSSAVYMAGAVALLYAVGLRILRLVGLSRVWWASGVGALLFAVAPTVWSMSLVARSYALNALLVGCVVFSLVEWRRTRNSRWFYVACLLVGLSMVHHGTTYLLLPAYGLYLLLVEVERHRRKEDSKRVVRWALGVLSLLVGLSPMLFLVYRFLWGAPYYWGNPSSWKDFFSLLTGGPFHNQVMGYGWGTQLERVGFGISELSAQYTLLGIVLGFVGLVVLWSSARGEAMLLTLMMAGNFFFAMNYSLVGYLYFIPTYLLWGVLMIIGLGWLAAGVARIAGERFGVTSLRVGATLVALGMVAGVAYLALSRYQAIDQSGQTATRDKALTLLNAAPQGASLYLDWEDLSVVRFYRMVYGMRLDTALYSGDPTDWPKGIYCDVTNGTAVYVGKFAGEERAAVARDFTVESAPIGWRVVGVKVGAAERYAVPPCGLCATCR
jgi:hypothetical protein